MSKGEDFDPVHFCLLFQTWPEEKRFPCMSFLLFIFHLFTLCPFPPSLTPSYPTHYCLVQLSHIVCPLLLHSHTYIAPPAALVLISSTRPSPNSSHHLTPVRSNMHPRRSLDSMRLVPTPQSIESTRNKYFIGIKDFCEFVYDSNWKEGSCFES